MLEIRGLTAGYGRFSVLKSIDLNVKKGESVFVVGPNGAGKSTLLKTVSGLLSPSGGTITFNGETLGGQPPEKLCRKGLALVPEGRSIFQTLTVRENLLLGGITRKDKEASAADLAKVLETFPILRKRYYGIAGHLSGGEQQQLAIARAILQRPSLLMIDEPSLGLAPLVIDQVYKSLQCLREDGLTLFVVEQSTARVLDLASRIYVLRNGSIVLESSAGELADGHALEEAYFGYGEHQTANAHIHGQNA